MSRTPRNTRRPSVRAAAPRASTCPDRFDLYTLCAQAPERDARLLRAIHADQPGPCRPARILGEDFSAAAALSRAWCSLIPRSRAIAVDHDPEALARARPHPRVKLVRSDVLQCRDKADLIAVLNFSICELHTRAALIRYLRHARARLRRGGCLVCDVYGGADAYFTGTVWQSLKGPRAVRIRYGWEQRTADPLAARVVNAMHFRIRPARSGSPQRRLHDAFVYDWRLWSVPELREAFTDAGFALASVYARTPGAIDSRGDFHVRPVEDPLEVGDAFNVLIVGRR